MEASQPAMSFSEIARRVGVSHTAIIQSYNSGMRKIRRNKEAMETLQYLLHWRERERSNTWQNK